MVHQADTVDVIVANSAGRDTLVKGFVYANIYGLTINPSRGDTSGGLLINFSTVYGLSGGGASFGDSLLSSWTVIDSTSAHGITHKFPTKGSVTVKVWNNSGDTISVVSYFTYTVSSGGSGSIVIDRKIKTKVGVRVKVGFYKEYEELTPMEY
jgi:hypothetical protein